MVAVRLTPAVTKGRKTPASARIPRENISDGRAGHLLAENWPGCARDVRIRIVEDPNGKRFTVIGVRGWRRGRISTPDLERGLSGSHRRKHSPFAHQALAGSRAHEPHRDESESTNTVRRATHGRTVQQGSGHGRPPFFKLTSPLTPVRPSAPLAPTSTGHKPTNVSSCHAIGMRNSIDRQQLLCHAPTDIGATRMTRIERIAADCSRYERAERARQSPRRKNKGRNLDGF